MTIGRHAGTYDDTRDGCTAHDITTPCDWQCVWKTYVGRHDADRGKCGTAYRVTRTAAGRHFRDGRAIIVTERDRGEDIPVWPGMVRHTWLTTTWPEMVAQVDTWRNRHPHQTFYVVPESLR
jgi:hypothetical protein